MKCIAVVNKYNEKAECNTKENHDIAGYILHCTQLMAKDYGADLTSKTKDALCEEQTGMLLLQ